MTRKTKRKIILGLLFVLIATGILFIPVQSGFLLTNNNGGPIYFFPDNTKQITVGWRHSVALTPWEETYQVLDNGSLSLESTRYMSYGAGTPDTEGITELLSDGFILVTGIKRVVPYYSLFYIPTSHYYIQLSGKDYPLSELVPDYEGIQIHHKTLLLHEWIYLKK